MAAPYSGANQSNSTTIPGQSRGALAVCLAAVGVLGLASAPRAQFTSGVNLVEVYATVTTPAGEPVEGLAREDFIVRENGEPQQVAAFAAGEFPLAAAIAVDRSFSMAGERLAVAKSSARTFLAELRPADESMIIAIGSRVETVAPRSTDRAAQYEALSRLDAFGTTGLHDAVIGAIESLQAAKGRRALILLSDGDDRFSTSSVADALARARKSDVLIYPVALARARPSLFVELAALTGGRSFHVREPKQLADTLRGIARELRHQYLLGYSPVRPIVAGQEEWRSINVTVNRPGVRVRARDGYLAK